MPFQIIYCCELSNVANYITKNSKAVFATKAKIKAAVQSVVRHPNSYGFCKFFFLVLSYYIFREYETKINNENPKCLSIFSRIL